MRGGLAALESVLRLLCLGVRTFDRLTLTPGRLVRRARLLLEARQAPLMSSCLRLGLDELFLETCDLLLEPTPSSAASRRRRARHRAKVHVARAHAEAESLNGFEGIFRGG